MTDSACLDEDQILAFASGQADAARIDALTEHVDHCRKCRLQLSAAVAAADELVMAPAIKRTTRTFARGDLIGGRYRVVRFIARGGMGEVYEARDELLDMLIALKTVAATISDDEQAAIRLKNEVQIARRVTHDNVSRLFDLGVHRFGSPSGYPEDSDGQLIFITMELLEGQTLNQYLRNRGRLRPDEVAAIVRQLTDGLGAAHRAGVIHRDLKCDNIMLISNPAGRHRVVIMDFGLARFGAENWPSAGLSAPGAVLGTMAYMAPEQVRGLRATPATDIYALGVVMFELLTGMLPFRADTPLSAALMRLDQEPPSPTTLAPEVGAGWASIVLRCMARDPDARFKSIDDVAAALDGLALSNARGPGAVTPAGRPSRGLTVALTLAGAAVLGIGTTVALRVPSRSTSGSAAPSAKPAIVAPASPAARPTENQAVTTTEKESAVALPPAIAVQPPSHAVTPARKRPRRPTASTPASHEAAPMLPVANPAPPLPPRVNDEVIDPFANRR